MDINLDHALEKLKHLETNLKTDKDNNLVWITFPYTPKNLKIVKKCLKILKWPETDYNLNFDENLIFIEKDVYDADI